MKNKNKQPPVEKKNPTILDFLGEKVTFDKFGGQYLWAKNIKNDGSQMLAQLRGWGAIQNLFEDQSVAAKFQDELGEWIADAINEKLQKEKLKEYLKSKEKDIEEYAASLVHYNIYDKEAAKEMSIKWHEKKFQGLELPMLSPYKIEYGKLIIDIVSKAGDYPKA